MFSISRSKLDKTDEKIKLKKMIIIITYSMQQATNINTVLRKYNGYSNQQKALCRK